MTPESSNETVTILLWVIGFLVAGYVGMGVFIRWLVVRVLSVVKSSTEANVGAKSSMEKLTKSIDRLIVVLEKEPKRVR